MCTITLVVVGLPMGVLEVGPSEHVVHLFTIEVTLDQTLGNWYHFIKPIHRNKNLLIVKYLINVVSCFIIFLSGLQSAILRNAFYMVGQGALGLSLWNQGGSGLKKFGNH
jgi:hypothetical protein